MRRASASSMPLAASSPDFPRWPALGRTILESILSRDLPVTQGALLLFAMAFITVNFAVDVLYTYVDPRIGYD